MHARLLRDYRTQYHDPVRFLAGETVRVDDRDTEWPEFLWATDPDGRSGWVHQRYLAGDTGETTAVRDYTARELDADAGQIVELIEEAGGWWWSATDDGRSGWLPARDIDLERNPS
ncbi:SH3 domain-containing protein [Arenimonas sp.]|uniref:SH3 domain-containing protein n=1 Tax=Arenimonas sp. TaxID=1872635 RepID=UPI0039E5B64A